MHTQVKLRTSPVGPYQANPAQEQPSRPGLKLPEPQLGQSQLMGLLTRRRSRREFSCATLPLPLLSNLLWAAYGVNRPGDNGRTAPSALNAQEVEVYVALPGGVYRFDGRAHCLDRVAEIDARRVAGYQDFVDEAPVELIYVVDSTRVNRLPAAEQELHAAACAGAIAQNVYLFCAEQGLATVLRAWFDRPALAQALLLGPQHKVLLAQTVGYPEVAEGDHGVASYRHRIY